MTYGIARPATGDELTLYNTPGKKSQYYCAIFQPHIIFTAQINQSFSTRDGVLTLTYDNATGDIDDVLPDMLAYIGSTPGTRDIGIARLRGIDGTKFYINQTSGLNFQNNQYVTVVDDFRLLQRHIRIVSKVPFMDGTVAYTDQHQKPDPTPIMGSHRILKLVDAEVTADFDWSDSYVIDGSAIDTYVTTCPTAVSIDNAGTTNPTIHFDVCGWHTVYLFLTGENESQFFGVRYVFVYNKDNMPARVKVANISGNIDSGGWQFEIEAYRHASLDDIQDGTLAILFSVDWYGDTETSIGAIAGSENIEAIGWIGSPENIVHSPDRSSVHFSVYGAWYWMQKISAYPDGVRFKISNPTAWTFFKRLTVDKGVWHFLHWRSTATRIFDFFPSGDARFSSEVSSLATDLWSQLQEMTALQILARPGFNALGQLFIGIHPQLTPELSRDWPTVMDISASDWRGDIQLDRVTIPEVTQSHLSGIAIDNGGNPKAYFAISPGHTYNHYGNPDVVDRLLLTNQAQVNTLAGLYFNFGNNGLPDIPVPLKANVRLIDCFPNQQCTITIPDGIRKGYTGAMFPKSITVNFDDTTGYANRDITFEAETFEGLAVKESVPGSGDNTQPPPPSFPLPPTFPLPLPGTPTTTDGGPPNVLMHDPGGIVDSVGWMYTQNFNAADPNDVEWYLVNANLTADQYKKSNNGFITPSGALYVFNTISGTDTFLSRAPAVGENFATLIDFAFLQSLYGSTDNLTVRCAMFNPLEPEHVIIAVCQAGENVKLFETFGAGLTARATFVLNTNNGANLSYGAGAWRFTANGKMKVLSPNASSVLSTVDIGDGNCGRHMGVSTTDIVIHWDDTSLITGQAIAKSTGNGADVTNNIGYSLDSNRIYENHVMVDYTGNQLMTRDNIGPNAVKSGDGGENWTNMTTYLGSGAQWFFRYCGGSGSSSRWIAAGSQVLYSDDFGATWTFKTGNLAEINPFMLANVVIVPGF